MTHIFLRAFMAIAALLALSTNALAASGTQGPPTLHERLQALEVIVTR